MMGFKTFALKSGVIFGDGDTYSLGCPETKEEKEARLEQGRSARQQYVNDLQAKFNRDPDFRNQRVEDQNNELVLTSPAANDLTPAMIRANWGAMFTGDARKNLCGIGFRGLRVQGTVNDTCTFISFGC